MDIVNEKVHYEHPFMSAKIFQSYRNDDWVCPWHYHKEVEILIILNGTLDVYVENEYYTMKKDDVLLIGSSQLHRDRSYDNGQLHYMVLQFDLQQYMDQSMMPYMKYFFETSQPLSQLNYIFSENREAKLAVFHTVQEIYDESINKKEGYEIAVSMLIKKIVLTLLRQDHHKILNIHNDADLARLKPVLDYVEQNLSKKIQVEQACKLVNFSYFYFVKYFKKVFGMSFLTYVHYKKMKVAERLLLTKDISIPEVGEAVGMPNMAHFYKVFKKYNNCSPIEFRKKMTRF